MCAWKYNINKLSDVTKITENGLVPIKGTKWEDTDIESIFYELEKMGIIKVNTAESLLKCPKCNNTTFYVLPACSNCGNPLIHVTPKYLIPSMAEQVTSNEELFKTLKIVGSKTVNAEEEISPDDSYMWQCTKCGSPVTSIKYLYRCSKCGYKIKEEDNSEYYDEKVYSIQSEKAGYYAGYIDDIISLFNEFGFATECLGTIVGQSGINHTFDFVINKHDTRLALTIEMGADEFSTRKAIEYYTKAYDTFNSTVHLLIAIPKLGEEQKRLFSTQSIDYIEAEDPQAAISELRDRIEMLNEKIKASTGIVGFDRIVEGGLLDKKVYLVLGEPGLGKTTLGLQFLIYGAKNSIPGILITTTQQPQEIIELADRLELELKKYMQEGKLAILDLTHQFEEAKAKATGDIWKYKTYVSKLVNDISKQVKRINAVRLVIDTVTPFIIVDDYDHAKELIDAISQLNCMTLLIKENIKQETYEANFVSGVINLRYELKGDRRAKVLFISKLRNSTYDAAPHEYIIKKGEGLVIS
ncbi:MAG: ATPase domain-containing protein [Conexivisphaerales archaeon]